MSWNLNEEKPGAYDLTGTTFCNLCMHLAIFLRLYIMARGGGRQWGALAPPLYFFKNYKELLRKRCFQPPLPPL